MSATFASQPFVCGALGVVREDEWLQLIGSAPAGTVTLDIGAGARFAATGNSRGLERVPQGWCWGRYIGRSTRATSIDSAANELGLAGYWRGHTDTAVVHGDALGFQDLYYRRLESAVYFSNRIEPLLAIRPAQRIHADWGAWARFFTFLGFTGSDTGFAEVRRLERSGRLTLTAAGVEIIAAPGPRWLTSPNASEPISGVAEALAEVVRDVSPGMSADGVDLTLSGGHDSRLVLAALQRSEARGLRASVTPHENGWDADVRVARQVAKASRIGLREVGWSAEDWIVARGEVASRLEFQTALHNWFSPLARSLYGSRRPLLDGLAGDKLLHYHALQTGSDPQAHRTDVLRRIGGWRISKPDILNRDVEETFSEITSSYWMERTAHWGLHPYAEVLYWLEHRTNRVIAAAPFRLFGPERMVVTPLIDPTFVAAVFNSRHSQPGEPDIRQRLLQILDPTLAKMETTNTMRSDPRSFVPRGLSLPMARLELASVVGRLPFARTIFRGQTLDRLVAGKELSPDALVLLRATAVLSDWYSAYHDRLANAEPDWT
ncbi:hypothetical protein [Microbacterium sp. NPDC058389]|uniref:hypothetical protein n=1 Tax=Microbacterium sp. NPDC058389 TaxID=3346475 RepID=UPI00364F4371